MHILYKSQRKNSNIMMVAVFLALIAPAVAELPSEAVNANNGAVEQLYSTSIINPMDPRYVWGNSLAIALSGVTPAIFQNAAFSMDPGGLMSGGLYTTSINDFRNADQNAGASNVTRKAATIGLVHWPRTAQ
jgi:hypothetical protein